MMLTKLRELLFGKTASPYGDYEGLVAQSLAASRSVFHKYLLQERTKNIDVETASLQDLVSAYRDLVDCIAIEYPETPEGSGLADALMPAIEAAVLNRFPEVAPPEREGFGRVWVSRVIVPPV